MCNFLIGLCKLHEIIVEFIVINNFVNLFDPFVIHKHFVVTVSYFFFPIHKLLVLWLKLVAKGLDV